MKLAVSISKSFFAIPLFGWTWIYISKVWKALIIYDVSSGFAKSDCDIVADSPNESLVQCFHAHDNTCAAFVEEDCVYNGTDTGTDKREIPESL